MSLSRVTRLALVCTAAVALCACGSEPTASKSTTAKGPSGPSDAAVALKILNGYRTQMSLPLVTSDSKLTQAAQAHSSFIIAHAGDSSCLPDPHHETSGCDGFTGVGPGDRVTAAGYTWQALGECVDFAGDPTTAIADWQSTVYHRLCIASPNEVQIGYARAKGGGGAADDIEVAYDPSAALNVISRWPIPDATDVERSWAGNESPQPPPPPAGYPSGPIISLIFSPQAPIDISAAQLTTGGQDVPSIALGPSNDPNGSPGAYFIYAEQPLLPMRQYTVTFAGTLNGSAYTDSWSFTTACSRGTAHDVACDGNDILTCGADGTLSRRSCGSDTCIASTDPSLSESTSALCVSGTLTPCSVPDGSTVRCDTTNNAVITCFGGYEKVAQTCGTGTVCAIGAYGGTCAEDPPVTCNSQSQQFLRCDGQNIIGCENGFEVLRSVCPDGSVCATNANGGSMCAVSPVTACSPDSSTPMGCLGNLSLLCESGNEVGVDCSPRYCTVNDTGSSAVCSSVAPTCSTARCAGQVPISCVNGLEVAGLACDGSTTTCQINGTTASCQ